MSENSEVTPKIRSSQSMVSKTSSLDFVLSTPQDISASCSHERLSDSTNSVATGKRPRRDSMDTTTANSTNKLEIPCKSPRTCGSSERPRSLSVADSVPNSSDSPYRPRDHSTPFSEEKLSKKQRKFLRQWHETFAQKDQYTSFSHETLTALATLAQAPPQLIHTYLQSKFPASSTTQPDPTQSYPLSAEHASTSAHLPPATLNQITRYLTTCARRRSPTDGRRSVNMGPLRCTFGCGYRTTRPFDWRRHEETHAPQDLWLCTLCRTQDATASPFLGHRKDKFLKHVRDAHRGWEGETVLGISRVEVRAGRGAEWKCPFCGGDNAGWEERCRHVLGHFGEGGDVGREVRGEGEESEVDGDADAEEGVSSGVSDEEIMKEA